MWYALILTAAVSFGTRAVSSRFTHRWSQRSSTRSTAALRRRCSRLGSIVRRGCMWMTCMCTLVSTARVVCWCSRSQQAAVSRTSRRARRVCSVWRWTATASCGTWMVQGTGWARWWWTLDVQRQRRLMLPRRLRCHGWHLSARLRSLWTQTRTASVFTTRLS